jgi:hypothetical protein
MVGCVALWVFNTIFNIILVVFWQLVLSVEETRVPSENHQPATSYWQTWSPKVVIECKLSSLSADKQWFQSKM